MNISGKHEEDTLIRIENALHPFDVEIRIMQNKAISYQANFLKIDEEIINTINQHSNVPQVVEELEKQWRREENINLE